MALIVNHPTSSDINLALCLALDPPTAGIHVGGGIHVEIPDDWKARILAGQDVAGCTYHRIEGDGSLTVSAAVEAALADPQKTKDMDASKFQALKPAISMAVEVVPVSDPVIGAEETTIKS